MSQAISRRLLTAETWVCPQGSKCGIAGQVFLRMLRVFPVSIIPPLPHIHSSSAGWTVDLLAAAVTDTYLYFVICVVLSL
jgi:hypothetical protein